MYTLTSDDWLQLHKITLNSEKSYGSSVRYNSGSFPIIVSRYKINSLKFGRSAGIVLQHFRISAYLSSWKQQVAFFLLYIKNREVLKSFLTILPSNCQVAPFGSLFVTCWKVLCFPPLGTAQLRESQFPTARSRTTTCADTAFFNTLGCKNWLS